MSYNVFYFGKFAKKDFWKRMNTPRICIGWCAPINYSLSIKPGKAKHVEGFEIKKCTCIARSRLLLVDKVLVEKAFMLLKDKLTHALLL